MTLSKKNLAIIEADRLGYYCDEQGNMYKPDHSLIKGSKTKGYRTFTVKLNENWVTVPFHRFIAFQRFGEMIFREGIVVRHLDNVKTNNSWGNIEPGTPKDNYMDLPKTVRISRARHAAKMRHAA